MSQDKFNSDLEGQMQDRVARVQKLAARGISSFANDFKITHNIGKINSNEADEVEGLPEQDAILPGAIRYSLAGRLVQIGDFGKIKFLFIRGDKNAIIQGLIRKNDDLERFELTKDIQVGDIIGFTGPLFKTKQGRRAIMIENLRLLTKAMRPLPGKILQEEQDVKDVELLYRQRYLDFIQHPDKVDVFRKRAKVISVIRECLDHSDFVEVETRMMLATNGGASARPFKTHHNTLDRNYNLRIAPELDLKRCIVGGMDRVYEIGRQFRNEGMDRFHNPEFTSLEFYQAYSTYENGMDMTEQLVFNVCESIIPHSTHSGNDQQMFVMYGDHKIGFIDSNGWKKPFTRKTMLQAVLDVIPELPADHRFGNKLVLMFEQHVEHTLIQPTFITQFPVEVSPLARKNDQDPRFTDRFELYMCGKEVANGFSELNDPADQRSRFEEQVKLKNTGNEETMDYDEDYCVALEYGMPPTCGVGIGIDRLVMMLTNQSSIRDVILFPQMA
jgi:lysyl-tRNA synthetase, class II